MLISVYFAANYLSGVCLIMIKAAQNIPLGWAAALRKSVQFRTISFVLPSRANITYPFPRCGGSAAIGRVGKVFRRTGTCLTFQMLKTYPHIHGSVAGISQ